MVAREPIFAGLAGELDGRVYGHAAQPNLRRGGAARAAAAFDEALAGFGDAADLKSPWFTGHSRGVAALARATAVQASPADATAAYRAGLLHDLGRVAVPAGVWERPGPYGLRNGNRCACTRTTPAGSWHGRRCSPRWA